MYDCDPGFWSTFFFEAPKYSCWLFPIALVATLSVEMTLQAALVTSGLLTLALNAFLAHQRH